MHKVDRGEEPTSLKDNKEQWTRELLEQIEIKGEYSKVDSNYKIKYKQIDVQKALKAMYGSVCCYCEGEINLTGYAEIEHYKPKSLFPELCFEWSNLHQICTKCNKKKNNKWDNEFPILDPVQDSIDDKIKFRGPVLCTEEQDKRVQNTIGHLELNKRSELFDFRSKLWVKALEYRMKDDAAKAAFKDLILSENNYPTFRKYLITIVEGK